MYLTELVRDMPDEANRMRFYLQIILDWDEELSTCAYLGAEFSTLIEKDKQGFLLFLKQYRHTKEYQNLSTKKKKIISEWIEGLTEESKWASGGR
jgi:hypothetical protein